MIMAAREELHRTSGGAERIVEMAGAAPTVIRAGFVFTL